MQVALPDTILIVQQELLGHLLTTTFDLPSLPF